MPTYTFPYYHIGHFVNRPDHALPFEITLFDEMEEPDIEDVHRHTFYEILWVDEGESRQTIDYKAYPLGRQSLFFISPGQVHEFEEWQPLKGGTILFTDEFLLFNQQNRQQLFELSFLDNLYTQPCLSLEEPVYQEVRHTIDLMLAERKRDNPSDAILRTLLQLLLLQIQRHVAQQRTDQPSSRQITLFKQFLALVEQHHAGAWTATDYAEQLHITQHHLNRIARNVAYKTATHIIRDRKMLEAKRFLTFTDLPIGEIAAALHFFDSTYFAKLFKSHTGMPPALFREEMSEKYRNR